MSVRSELTRAIERAVGSCGYPPQSGGPTPRVPLRLHRQGDSPVWTFPVRPDRAASEIAEALANMPGISTTWIRESGSQEPEGFVTVALTQATLAGVLDDHSPEVDIPEVDNPRVDGPLGNRASYPPGEGPEYACQRLTAELALAATELPDGIPIDRSTLNTPAEAWLLALLVETPDVYAGAGSPRGARRLHRHLDDLADVTLDWLARSPPRPVTWHTPATSTHAARVELAARVLATLNAWRQRPAPVRGTENQPS